MESIIIKEIEMMLELPLHERQKAYFQDLLNAAKPVKIVPAADVLEDYELDYIRHVIKPKPKECYRNSHLLCEAFPERVLYCEGKTNVPIPIDHAFNKVGDAYIDITFEFALHENPSIYEYVTFGEYDANTIRKAVLETGYYGEIYKWLYYHSKKKKDPRRHKSICTGGILRSNRERYLVDAVQQKYIVYRKLQNNPQK